MKSLFSDVSTEAQHFGLQAFIKSIACSHVHDLPDFVCLFVIYI